MISALTNTFMTVALYVILIYGLLALAFYFISDKVLFQPPPASYKDDNNDVIKIPLKTGGEISAIYLFNPVAKYTILFSHGNAEDLGNVYPLLLQFYQRGYSILAYDYEGYGASKGIASEENTYSDILAAYHFLTVTKQNSPTNIIIFGRSLGTGPSIYLASQLPARALILQSPFVSAFRVVTNIALLPFDKYPNLKRMSKITIPLLVIHGKKDNIIPFWQGKKIFAESAGIKQNFWIDNGDHNDLIDIAGESYWQAIQHFMSTVEQKNPNSKDTSHEIVNDSQ